MEFNSAFKGLSSIPISGLSLQVERMDFSTVSTAVGFCVVRVNPGFVSVTYAARKFWLFLISSSGSWHTNTNSCFCFSQFSQMTSHIFSAFLYVRSVEGGPKCSQSSTEVLPCLHREEH